MIENNLDKQYTDLLQTILDYGVEKKDRTGTGTKSIFGYTIRHKMSDGFPLLTTKKLHWKSIVTELLWFLRGDTNIKYLVDNNCHIWDGDAYKNYTKYPLATIHDYHTNILYQNRDKGWCLLNGRSMVSPHPTRHLTQEEFINKIKTDNEFAKKWGELGPIYGKQWRNWEADDLNAPRYEHWKKNVDQIANLINDLKTNPDSRRLMVNAWNVGEIDQMVLPPCHYGFQVYTRELSERERLDYAMNVLKIYRSIENGKIVGTIEEHFTKYNIPTRAISLMWNQRSVDTFLGLPFNIASYGLLLEIIAKEVNMVPDELIGNLGDTHLYLNHIEQAKEQIGEWLDASERMDWWFKNNKPNRDVCDYVDSLGVWEQHQYFDLAGVSRRSREPFELPKLKINGTEPSIIEKPKYWRPEDFEIIDYKSHPTIKAPLSN